MAALPEIMTMYQDRKYDQAPAKAVAAHGLGLFNGAIVEQHFDGKGGRLERFTGLLRDSAQLDTLAGRSGAGANMLGLAVEETTALVLQGNRLETIGQASAHVFVKASAGRTVVWHELPAGEAARLDRDAQGTVILRRDKPAGAN
jgi:cyanophycinase-like exopeptidase